MRNIPQHRKAVHQNYIDSLATAHVAAQEALNALYDEHGPNRRFWQRWRLGRAQSILISMHVKELNKQKKEN